jgi:hypothetical protein
MLLEKDFLDFNKLMIFTKSIHQSEYQMLYNGFKNGMSKESIKAIFKTQHLFKDFSIPTLCEYYAKKNAEIPSVEIMLTDKTNTIPAPQDLDKNKKNLIIFDDCVNEKNQDIMKMYYTRGRHSNCNCIYLSQSYFELDRRSIRGNSNFFIMFKMPARDRSIFFNDNISTEMELKDFKLQTDNIWEKPHSYVAINTTVDPILITDNIFE